MTKQQQLGNKVLIIRNHEVVAGTNASAGNLKKSHSLFRNDRERKLAGAGAISAPVQASTIELFSF
jgi:hypothetical protein